MNDLAIRVDNLRKMHRIGGRHPQPPRRGESVPPAMRVVVEG